MEHCALPWWQIIVAAFAYFSLGAIWYNPKIFGTKWAAAHGITPPSDEEKKKMGGMLAKVMTTGFIISLFQTAIICCVCCMSAGMCHTAAAEACVQGGACCAGGNLMHCAGIGAMMGFGFALAQALGYNYLQKPANAYIIDGGYSIIGSIIAAVVLGLLGAC